MDRDPWHAWLTPAQYARLFPGGQAELDHFYDRAAERERAGVPAVCHDWATYLEVAHAGVA